jgi:hypothetical protein
MLAAGVLALPAAAARGDASELSMISAFPVASVVVVAGTAASVVLTVPLALADRGAQFVVKGVEASARGTICVLERVSDGVQVSVEIAARGAGAASLAVGTVVTSTAIGAGVLLSAAGEVIAFIPNAIGRELLYNQRLTY